MSARATIVARWVVRGCVIAFALFMVLACTARWVWWGELAVSFCWYAGLAALALVPAGLAVRAWLSASAAAVLAFVALAPSLWLWLPNGAPERPLSSEIVCGNLLWGNPSGVLYVEGLRHGGPDVAAFLEISPRTRAALLALQDVYPHQVWFPADPAAWDVDTWGLAIVSRTPIGATASTAPLEGHMPVLEARIALAGGDVLLRLAHAPDPSSAERWRLRDRFLERLAHGLDWPAEALLVGDLNVTGSSPSFAALLDVTRLSDGRRGFGRQATWHPAPPWDVLPLDLDHTLSGARLEILDRRTEPIPGSDHEAVRARIRVR